jgi:hypothetical protein
LVPGLARRLRRAPLKPPVDTSYGDVTSPVDTLASRGRLAPPNGIPLSVVWFWSGERPSTEKPAGSPSAPGTGVTPGIAAAIAARSPICSGARSDGSTRRSGPPTSAPASVRPTRSRAAVTRTAPSRSAAYCSVASARRKSSSATRRTWTRRGA